MKTSTYFKILILLCCTGMVKAQCTPNIVSNISTGCAPLSVIFNCNNFNNAACTWSAGTYSASGLTASINFTAPAVYTVICTVVTTTPACTGTASLIINVVTGPAYGCPTPVDGLKELFADQIFIYPNPSKGIFNIRFDNYIENTKVVLLNALGQKVYEEKLSQGLNAILCNGFEKGLYFLKLYQHENLLRSEKLVIE